MGFDFSSDNAQVKDTATLSVEHPKEGDIGVDVTIAGRDSELCQSAFAKYRKGMLSDDNEKSDLELLAEFCASITVEWEGVEFEDEVLECNYDNAYKLYSKRQYKWLTEQIDSFALNRSNYLGN